MSSHFIRRGLSVVGVLAVLGGSAHVAQADEVDDLLAEMDELSQEASAKNEEVKDLEGKVDESRRSLDELDGKVAATREAADRAQAAERDARNGVDLVAGSRYRGSSTGDAVSVLGADNPQMALDRSAYLSTLGRQAEKSVKALEDATATADRERDRAARARAEAEYRSNRLASQLEDLNEEKEQLDARTAELTERIDGLDEEARARWEGKYGPLAPTLDPAAAEGVVGAALSKLGAPYSWGAAGPDAFDCSGLMFWAYQQQGKSIPRTSQAQIAGGTPVSRADLQPGDIVGYYPGVTHVGMYIGNGQVVHASDYGIPVQVVSVDSMPFAGAARY